MSDKAAELQFGKTYTHNDSGVRYKLVKTKLNATDYEKGIPLSEYVEYVQLEQGEKCPAGTEYVREINNFTDNFTLSE